MLCYHFVHAPQATRQCRYSTTARTQHAVREHNCCAAFAQTLWMLYFCTDLCSVFQPCWAIHYAVLGHVSMVLTVVGVTVYWTHTGSPPTHATGCPSWHRHSLILFRSAEMRLEPASSEAADLQRWLAVFSAPNPSMVRHSSAPQSPVCTSMHAG